MMLPDAISQGAEISGTGGRGCRITSEAVTLNPSQSMRGRILAMKVGLKSISCCSSSASRKWRGKDCGEVLQALTAQVRKLTVRIFISGGTGVLKRGEGVLGKFWPCRGGIGVGWWGSGSYFRACRSRAPFVCQSVSHDICFFIQLRIRLRGEGLHVTVRNTMQVLRPKCDPT